MTFVFIPRDSIQCHFPVSLALHYEFSSCKKDLFIYIMHNVHFSAQTATSYILYNKTERTVLMLRFQSSLGCQRKQSKQVFSICIFPINKICKIKREGVGLLQHPMNSLLLVDPQASSRFLNPLSTSLIFSLLTHISSTSQQTLTP